MDKRLLTVKQVAEFLSISIQTVWAWRVQGRLPPAVKIGKAVRYDIKDLEKFIFENKEK